MKIAVSNKSQADAGDSTDLETQIVTMHLKWFNASKGFGFLVPEDGSYDAFFHVTILQDAGLNCAGEGAAFKCEVYDSDKGKQVKQITEVISSGKNPLEIVPTEKDGMMVIGGIVKWYKPEKGFGFIIADDGLKDIFIHKSLLQRMEIEELKDGDRVKVTVKNVDKGREAAGLEVVGRSA